MTPSLCVKFVSCLTNLFKIPGIQGEGDFQSFLETISYRFQRDGMGFALIIQQDCCLS